MESKPQGNGTGPPTSLPAMSDDDYEKLLAALSAATTVFARHPGGFSSSDLLIRSLVRLAEREVALAYLQSNSRTHRLKVAITSAGA